MRLAELLQAGASWRFDLYSALIGAVLAWIIAGALFMRQHALKQTAQRLWKPITAWRRRMQSSEEEKYLRALQETLRGFLIFAPRDPQAIFIPPTLLSPAPLPESSSDGEMPTPLTIAFSHLHDGHTRLIVAGAQASGRTTALAMSVWETAQRANPEEPAPYERFPIWVNLALKSLAPQYPAPIDRLTSLAALTLPAALPKWLAKQLKALPSLILVDNWETIPAYERNETAKWLAEAADALPNSLWIISANLQGYGPLVEHGFVPLEIIPPTGEKVVATLAEGWWTLLQGKQAAGQTPPELPEGVLKTFKEAIESGATLLEMNLRAVLYWQQQQAPARFTEVLEAYLNEKLPTPDLGEDQLEVAMRARELALAALKELARRTRLEGRLTSSQELDELVFSLLPPEAERPPKLEGALKRLIQKSELLTRSGKELGYTHYVWQDYLTTLALVEDPTAPSLLQEHLHDPKWYILLECFAGLGDVTPLIKTLLQEYQQGDDERLFQVVRWATLSPEDTPWRKVLMKLLAQVFVAPQTTADTRLRIGRALVLSAGNSARVFFLQALRHPTVEARAVAVRGIGWTGTPQDINILNGALTDEHAEIRLSAIQALADMATPGAVRLLKNTLFNGDEQMTLNTARVLARFSDGWDALKQATGDEDLLIRRAAAQGLGLINQPWASEILRKMALEDPQWLVRSSAEGALAAKQEKTHEKVTVPPPPKPDSIEWLMSWAAEQGLGLGVGQAAKQTLFQAIHQGDPETQIMGALTLAYIGDRDSIDALIPLTHTDHPGLKTAAETAIQWIRQRYRGVEDQPPPEAPEPSETPSPA